MGVSEIGVLVIRILLFCILGSPTLGNSHGASEPPEEGKKSKAESGSRSPSERHSHSEQPPFLPSEATIGKGIGKTCRACLAWQFPSAFALAHLWFGLSCLKNASIFMVPARRIGRLRVQTQTFSKSPSWSPGRCPATVDGRPSRLGRL